MMLLKIAIIIHDLINVGFPNEVISALSILTHNKDMSYFEYIKSIKKNPIATKVKIEV